MFSLSIGLFQRKASTWYELSAYCKNIGCLGAETVTPFETRTNAPRMTTTPYSDANVHARFQSVTAERSRAVGLANETRRSNQRSPFRSPPPSFQISPSDTRASRWTRSISGRPETERAAAAAVAISPFAPREPRTRPSARAKLAIFNARRPCFYPGSGSREYVSSSEKTRCCAIQSAVA